MLVTAVCVDTARENDLDAILGIPGAFLILSLHPSSGPPAKGLGSHGPSKIALKVLNACSNFL